MTDSITPMATGYIEGRNGNTDVQYSTSGVDGFSNFDCGEPQKSDYKHYKSDSKNHHMYPYSEEAINNIDETIDSYPEGP